MPGANDVMLARLSNELEERAAFQEQLVEGATNAGRDLEPGEMELYNRAASRIAEIEQMLAPMRESARITAESRVRTAEIARYTQQAGTGGGQTRQVEYRSAGEWIADYYQAYRGDDEAAGRIEYFNRAADHQVTSDNPGLLPERIVAPIVNRMDAARPIVSMIGTQDPGEGAWAYPTVTQHTEVAVQSAEKAELASQKMTITLTSITPATYGGYVNISRQNIRRTSPGIVDIIVNDLAAQYAIATENAAADALYAGATAGTNTAVVAASTPEDITAALWVNVGQQFTAMQGQGRLFLAISPDLLGLFGPAFGPAVQVEAAAPSSGFSLAGFGSGPVGQISGVPVVVSAGMNTNRALLINTEAVLGLEYRYGNLQVSEPSVLGLQVAYAGDFKVVIRTAGGLIAMDTVA